MSIQRRLRILYNALRLDEAPPFHNLNGNFYHVRYLAGALAARDDVDLTVLCDQRTFEPLLEVVPRNKLVLSSISVCGTIGRVVATDYAVIRAVQKFRPDVYHQAHGQLPLWPISCPSVVTISDIHHFTVFPTKLLKRVYKHITVPWTFFWADHVTCLSNYTMRDVLHHFRCPNQKISVIYPGTNELPTADYERAEKIGSPFWVAFGHQHYKNVETALAALKRRPPAEKLLVVGQSHYIEDSLKGRVAEMGLAERVIFAGRISRQELAGFLKRALGLLFLSWYEGFGLPVLEAMSVGCPVVSSNVCSLPEVAGTAAVAVRPNDVEGIVSAMNLLRSDSAVREDRIKTGYLQAAKFTYDREASEIMDTYRRVLAPPVG